MVEIDIGHVLRPKEGENSCGDSILVHCFPQIIRLAVIDGLGHGPEAAQAAAEAKKTLTSTETLGGQELISQCHNKLMGTRGAVVGVVDLDKSQNMWRGISLGNISIAFYGQEHYLPATNGGIVGYNLPTRLVSWSRPYSPGQILIMHSDGIHNLAGLGELLAPTGGLGKAQAQHLAESIAVGYGKIEDDLAILVAK
jgi:hypothetical protein